MGDFCNWESISEDEIRDMLEQYYAEKGFNVEVTHGSQELGIDLRCRKSDEDDRGVIIKRRPGQDDIGQVVTARQQIEGQLEYYYTGEPSGLFSVDIKRVDENIRLFGEDEIEDEMIGAENFYIFYFAFSYHPALVSLSKIIVDIFRRCEGKKTEMPSKKRITKADSLNFFEGAVQGREIVNMSLNDVRRCAIDVQGRGGEIQKQIRSNGATLIRNRLDRLATVCSDKLEVARSFPKTCLINTLYGREAWGNTYTSWFSSDSDDISVHQERVLGHIIHGYGYEYHRFGLNESAACLQQTEFVMRTLVARGRLLLESPST